MAEAFVEDPDMEIVKEGETKYLEDLTNIDQ